MTRRPGWHDPGTPDARDARTGAAAFDRAGAGPLPALAAASALALACAITAGPAAAADLSVTFTDPQRYADAAYADRPGTERERAAVLRELEAHLRRLAERHLQAGDALRIEVLDVDLAGEVEPFAMRGLGPLRVLREVTPPRMLLRYALRRGERPLAAGEARLSDPDYLAGAGRLGGTDRLRYEKAMLDRWFETTLSALARP